MREVENLVPSWPRPAYSLEVKQLDAEDAMRLIIEARVEGAARERAKVGATQLPEAGMRRTKNAKSAWSVAVEPAQPAVAARR